MSASSKGAARHVRSRPWIATAAAVGALAVLVGTLTVARPAAAAMVAVGTALAAVLWTSGRQSRPTDISGKSFWWVSFAWVFVLLRPVGAETIYEYLGHGAIGVLAIISLMHNRLRGWPPWPLLALPALSLVSAAWSLTPGMALATSLQLLVIALLATLTIGIGRADRTVARTLILRTLRLTVQVVAVLCVLGLLIGNPAQQELGQGRFGWPGANPVAAAATVGVAFLVLIFGRRETNFRIPTAAALVSLFSVCLYLGRTRTALIGLALTALLGYWIASRRRPPFLRLAGGLAIALVVLFVVARFGGTIQEYLYRGEPQQTIQSFNGRIPLWEAGLQLMNTPMRWIGGYGAGSTSVLFASLAPWAADAHSAWLQALLSLGLLGVAAGAVLVILVGLRLFGGPLESPVLPILFIYLVAMSPAGSNFGIPGPGPGLGYGLLALCYAATAARGRAPYRGLASPGPRLERDLRLAPI